MKKAGLIAGIVLALLAAAGVIAVLTVSGSLIGKDAAEQIACKDAGVEPPYCRTELEFENGHFQYDVEFYVNGIEYEYYILAKNGEMLFRNTKGAGLLIQDSTAEASIPETEAPVTEPESEAPTAEPETQAPETEPETQTPETEPETEAPATEPDAESEAGEEQPVDEAELAHAKVIAMSGAGLMDRQDEVEFTDEKWYTEGDKLIFEFKFYLDETEYEYKVSAFGEVLKASSWPKQN